MTNNTNRINYIDALRGFTMFLVVFGHVMHYSFNLGGYETIIGSIFLTFRMPLFFFVAGLFTYKSVSDWNAHFYLQNIKKKFLIQIIPTIFFFSLYVFCKGGNPVAALKYGFDGYWFTIVLFEMFAIYYTISLVCKYIKTPKTVDYIMILCSIVGMIVLIFFRGDGRLWNILCLENLVKYFQFFTLGILCKKYFNRFINIVKNEYFKTTIILVFIICLVLYFNDSFKYSYPLMYKGIHDILIRYAGVILVYMIFYHYQDFFNKETTFNKTLLLVGRRTLDIYLLHYFFIPDLSFLKDILAPSNMMLVQFTLASIISIIIIMICLLLSSTIRISDTLGSYLLGAKKSQKKS